ncbi:hypothetical protein [Microcoleus sp. Pol12B5]|uniref:hypothetical protein n=1 Tax=Microcoleus sp. Pol12B5 TaxID=3055396 RepID=UPI002FD268BB
MSNENKDNSQKQKPKLILQNQRLRELQQQLDKLSESHGSLLEQNQRIEQKLDDLKSLLENRPDIITSQVDEPSDKQYEDRLVFNRGQSREVLSDALENVQDRLILVCPWLTSWATAVVIEKCTAVIVQTVVGLADDSVVGMRNRIELRLRQNKWEIVWIGRQSKCQPNRGHQDWASGRCR